MHFANKVDRNVILSQPLSVNREITSRIAASIGLNTCHQWRVKRKQSTRAASPQYMVNLL
jgi:hypothetical protein